MNTRVYDEFVKSEDKLRVYDGSYLLFSSDKDGLLPLLEYISIFPASIPRAVILDKVMGNAAALLSVIAGCREIFSPLGSELAAITLKKYDIKYYFTAMVPYILKLDGKDMCPLEKLSLGKDPDKFYEAVKSQLLLR